MDFPRIRYFLEVARQKNFTRAAEACNISQPSLSQQIKKLEDEVGGELFLRSRTKVALSPLGEAFMKHARAIMAEVSTAEEFVSETRSRLERTVRFGAIPTIAPFLIPEIFSEIRQFHSDVRLELMEKPTEALVESLRMGEIDFALLSPPIVMGEGFESVVLAEDELLLTLPVGHPLSQVEVIDLAALRDAKILLMEGSHCLAQQAAAYCEEYGLRGDLQIRSSQIDTLLCLVEAGFGLTFTPSVAARVNAHRQVVFRSLGPNQCRRKIALYWMSRHVMPRFQETLLDGIRARFGG